MKKSDFIKHTSTKGMSQLDTWLLLDLVTEMIKQVQSILFPNGKYRKLKWYHATRLIKLGRILLIFILKWYRR
jgi:hypothetical protein